MNLFDPTESVRKWIALGLAIAVLCFLFAVLTMCDAREKARKSDGEARVATSQADLGADAGKRADAVREAEKANSDLTQSNTDFIEGANNADQDAGDAGRRGWIAYCERERLRGRPESASCAQLRRPDPQ